MIKWYRFLKPKEGRNNKNVLLKNIGENLENYIIIRNEKPRQYTAFEKTSESDKLIKLRNFLDTVEVAYFHEIVPPDVRQKPRWDLDVEFDKGGTKIIAQKLLEQIITGILAVAKEAYNLDLDIGKDIRVCSSHRENKCSFHIIISSFCVGNCLEAAAFHEKVIKFVDTDYLKFVDPACKAFQSLRILGSTKPGIDCKKKVDESILYKNKVINTKYNIFYRTTEEKFLYLLGETLLSYTEGLSLQYGLSQEAIYIPVKNVEDSLAIEAMNLLAKKFGLSDYTVEEFPFSYRDTKGKQINLNRVYPTECTKCSEYLGEQTIHEKDYSYLNIEDSGDVYFVCGRTLKRMKYHDAKVFLGSLNKQIENKFLDKMMAKLKSNKVVENKVVESEENKVIKINEVEEVIKVNEVEEVVKLNEVEEVVKLNEVEENKTVEVEENKVVEVNKIEENKVKIIEKEETKDITNTSLENKKSKKNNRPKPNTDKKYTSENPRKTTPYL